VISHLWPLSTYSSPSRTALALMSFPVPPSGSVRLLADQISPVASLGRYFRFCSSVPNTSSGRQNRPFIVCATNRTVAYALDSSSSTLNQSTALQPCPPYSVGMVSPKNSPRRSSSTNSSGRRSSSSSGTDRGSSTSSTQRRARAFRSSVSSESMKSIKFLSVSRRRLGAAVWSIRVCLPASRSW